ncbi:lipid II flippase MurJ [Aquabacter sp. CN5-332]|uniref:murein biosynthesis integral membrane protein MurJ n=1 Tax=Aquabacter sp. CN5-332 TaxID=3156608 RepID=UPI0032B4AA9F
MSSSPRSLIAKTSAVSAATLGSRLLGFARDMGTAAVLGAGPLADALMASLSLPLLARRLLAEGAFNAALLPALAAAPDDERAAASANATLVLLCMILLGFAVVGALAMPILMLVLAPGFSFDGERADLASACGRIALFYLPLAGAAAVLGGIANAAHRVFLPALAPALGNAVVLFAIAAIILEGLVATPTAALVMAACAVLAGIAQLALMIAAARKAPASIRISAGFDWPAARAVLRASRPALLLAGLPQMRIVLLAVVVSAHPGAVAALNYAQRLIDLPLGLVGASAGAILVPLLTTGAGGTGRGVETARAVLSALGFALPAATGLIMLADPIITVLYQRGSFTAENAHFTAFLLTALAFTLPAQGLEKVLGAAAMSHGFGRQVEGIALVSLLNTMAFAVGFGIGFGPGGGAFGIAIPACVSVARLWILLSSRGHLVFDRAAKRQVLGMVLGCFLLAVVVLFLLVIWIEPEGTFLLAVRLGVLVAAGMATYGAVWFAFRPRNRPRAEAIDPGHT